MMLKISTIAILAWMIHTPAIAQESAPAKPWAEISKDFRCPQWFSDAKFGIWVHWGAQTQPAEGGGWYARHMYMTELGREQWGKNAYPYHLKTYGHPSEKGFKDVIHAWKADKLDADNLLAYFHGLGAKYFVALANHHDHFDNFASTHQPWNSVNVGPKRDIIGEFAAASKKIGMPFGVSSHDDRMLMYYEHAFDSDKSGPKAGVPYDGNLTKADGAGKWWDGLDPADLYGPPPAKRTAAWVAGMKHKWKLRHKELIDKYHPDMLWFDGSGFPYGAHGKEVCRYFYDLDAKDGKFDGVVAAKIPGERAVIKDIERGGAETILPDTWQGTTTFTSWFYKTDRPVKHDARTVIEVLVDMISKNGNLLLNVELLPDGTIPPAHKAELDQVGRWVNLNAVAIHASKPWVIFGDNLNSSSTKPEGGAIGEADPAAATKTKKTADFNERTLESPPYGHNEVRFTVSAGNTLHIIVLNPAEGEIVLPSLGRDSTHKVKAIQSIRLIGSDARIDFHQDGKALRLVVPASRPTPHSAVFSVTGAL